MNSEPIFSKIFQAIQSINSNLIRPKNRLTRHNNIKNKNVTMFIDLFTLLYCSSDLYLQTYWLEERIRLNLPNNFLVFFGKFDCRYLPYSVYTVVGVYINTMKTNFLAFLTSFFKLKVYKEKLLCFLRNIKIEIECRLGDYKTASIQNYQQLQNRKCFCG